MEVQSFLQENLILLLGVALGLSLLVIWAVVGSITFEFFGLMIKVNPPVEVKTLASIDARVEQKFAQTEQRQQQQAATQKYHKKIARRNNIRQAIVLGIQVILVAMAWRSWIGWDSAAFFGWVLAMVAFELPWLNESLMGLVGQIMARE